jgi:hypothetical protein
VTVLFSHFKGIKLYKHVVQSVEKFIQKCRPEYKIPGLYVIDSIVRQSRHQFGADKDVFAPRFAKSLQFTFHHLYKCNPEEKSRVIRVLNLWQKNEVFPPNVVQPLFDLADPDSATSRSMDEQIRTGGAKAKTPTKTGQSTSLASRMDLEDSHGDGSSDQYLLQQLETIRGLLQSHSQSGVKKLKLDFEYSDDEDNAEQGEDQPTPAMLEALQG